MIIVRSKDIEYLPASHDDPNDPQVWKKVLFKKEELIKGRIQMIYMTKLPVGKTFKKHYHEDMEEVFIILNGKTRILIENEEAELEKGDAVLVPVKSAHQMSNICDEDVQFIAIGITEGKNGKTVVV